MKPNSLDISVPSALISPHKLVPFLSSPIPHLSAIAPFSLLSGLEAVCASADWELLEHCLVQTEVLTSWLLTLKRTEFHVPFPEPGTCYLDFFPLGDLCTSISFKFVSNFKLGVRQKSEEVLKKELGEYRKKAFFFS